MAFTKIDRTDYNGKGVIGLPDAPQLSTTAMQEKFEEISTDVIIPKHNALIDELEASTGASSIGTTLGNVQSDIDSFNGKIATYNGDISQLKTDMTQAKADILTLQTDDVTEKADIASLKTDNTANIAQIATNKNDIASLKTDNTTNKTDIANLKADNTTNKSDIASLKTDNTSNKSRITALENDNTTNKSKITSLTSDVAVLNSVKHTHTNKTVIDALSKDATTGNLMFEGNPISGGGGSANAYGHVKVGSVTLNASGDDTVEFIAGSNVTLTPNASGKTITIASVGGGGIVTGDMTKAEFVDPLTGTGQVLSAKEADHATNADNADNATNAVNATTATTAISATSATTAGQVGSAITSVLEGLTDNGSGKLQYNGTDVNDITVDTSLSTTSNNPIANSTVATSINGINTDISGINTSISGITAKLSKIDTTTSSTTNDGDALAWDSNSSTFKAQTIKGGHTMTANIDEILTVTKEENTVVNAFDIADFSNVYTVCKGAILQTGENTIGKWFNEGETWDTSQMFVQPEFIEGNGEELHFEFDFWVGEEVASKNLKANSTPLHLAGYQWDSTAGALTIKCVEDAPNDITVLVKVTKVRER